MTEPEPPGPALEAADREPDQPQLVRVRVRKRRRVRRRRGRVLLLGAGVLVLLALAVVGWLAFTGSRARHHLEAVQSEIEALRGHISAGEIVAARADAQRIVADANAAHANTTGPVWAGAAAVPLVGTPLDTARAVTSSVALVADRALPALIDATDHLAAGHLRSSDGAIDLAAIERLEPVLRRAGATVAAAVRGMRAAPGSTWLGSVDTARHQVIDKLTPLRHTVAAVAKAVRLVPPLLGADGPRNYMITFQNEAELRPTGGLPGAFGILHVDAGALRFTRFEPDNYLVGTPATGLQLGPQYDTLFDGSLADFRDSNQSPHFPYAARIWAAMWHAKTGQTLDGALAIDPTALSYLLQATGPVTLPDGEQVSANNVVALTQQTIYAKFPQLDENEQRKQYLITIAATVSKALLNPSVDPAALVQAAQRAAAENRLLLWTSNPGIESQLADLPLGGAVPKTRAPYAAVLLQNFSQSKLDYYLHATLTYRRSGCGPTRSVIATVTLSNDAPSELPPYVIGNSSPKGDADVLVGLYGSTGGRFTSVTVNGKRPFNVEGTDRGHPVFIGDVNVPRGRSASIVFRLTEPPVDGPLTLRTQPMINPMTADVSQQACR